MRIQSGRLPQLHHGTSGLNGVHLFKKFAHHHFGAIPRRPCRMRRQMSSEWSAASGPKEEAKLKAETFRKFQNAGAI